MVALPPDVIPIDTDEAARRLRVSRDTLDRMTREAPATLPGGPVDVGSPGGKRRRLMWNPATLLVWWEAYGAWRATRGNPALKSSGRRKPRPAPANTPGRGKLSFAEISAAQRGR